MRKDFFFACKIDGIEYSRAAERRRLKVEHYNYNFPVKKQLSKETGAIKST